MGVFAGTERQCTEDEDDDEDEHDSQISEFGLKGSIGHHPGSGEQGTESSP
jgi:hypothetical protein